MKKRSMLILLGVIFVSFLCTQISADSGGLGVAAKASTLGAGLEFATRISSNLNLRLGVNGYDYEFDGRKREIDYDIDLKLFSAGGFVDWYPLVMLT
jgi:hypothetical protein